jgi:hypothetical protein
VDGSCEHGKEPSGSIKVWEILEWLPRRAQLHLASSTVRAGLCVQTPFSFVL